METEALVKAKTLSEKIARTCGVPRFFREQKVCLAASSRLLEESPLVASCIRILTARVNVSGHGFSHSRKVARDAGAIIMIERGTADEAERLATLAHIAGILHDIKRSNKDHAQRGADEAKTILREFDLTHGEQEAVVGAIRNHEAFQPCIPLADPDAQFLSDTLYDADKFRWGPDNFTEMLWDIAETRHVSVETLTSSFPSGLESLRKIRGTFRTTTGRRYGPDFIDRGLQIGERLYAALRDAFPQAHNASED
jgi:hypothetical protein